MHARRDTCIPSCFKQLSRKCVKFSICPLGSLLDLYLLEYCSIRGHMQMKGTVAVSIQINKIKIQLLYHEPALSKSKSINWYNQGWNNNKCSYQIWFDIRDVCYKINLVDESIPLWLCKKRSWINYCQMYCLCSVWVFFGTPSVQKPVRQRGEQA